MRYRPSYEADPLRIVVLRGGSGTSALTTTTPDDPRTREEKLNQGGPVYTWTITDAAGASPASLAGNGASATLTAGRTAVGESKVRVQVVIHWPCAPGTGQVRDTTFTDVIPVLAIGIQTRTRAEAQNPDRARRTIGVGEVVDLTLLPTNIPPPPVTWTLKGLGSLRNPRSNPARFTAHHSASNPSITVTCEGQSLTVQFNVVEPTHLTGRYHSSGGLAGPFPGVWMRTIVTVQPTHVSFYRVAIHEHTALPMDRDGYYEKGREGHTPPAHPPQKSRTPSEKNQMTDMAGCVEVRRGPYRDGSYTWNIRSDWRVEQVGTRPRFFAKPVPQVMTIDATGTCTVSKFGASASAGRLDP